jgi:biopolymer transport protein ExbB/TolQ
MLYLILGVISLAIASPISDTSMSGQGPQFSWIVVIPICIAQVVFAWRYWREKSKISVRFKDISNSDDFRRIISSEEKDIEGKEGHLQTEETLTPEERELQLFIKPHLYRLLKAGESINWEEINSQLLNQALRAEEVARSWMNNIIVLGLFGTATSIAIPIFIQGYDVKEILSFLPPAFVPAAIGLLLGIICSLFLSYRLRNTNKEAEELTDKFKEYFPYPVSTADISQGELLS